MSTSTAQIIANQANAQNSTGPRTDAGKAASSRNAAVHSLCSAKQLVARESKEEYDALHLSWSGIYKPVGAAEITMLGEVVETQWRLMRLRRTETPFLNQLIDEAREEQPDIDPDTAIAMAFFSKEQSNRMRLFLRYQTAIENAASRAIARLEKAQKERRTREAEEAANAVVIAAMTTRAAGNGFVSKSTAAVPPSRPSQPAPASPNAVVAAPGGRVAAG